MADRKQFLGVAPPPDEELLGLLRDARNSEVSEEVLKEQRVSFAYGNALHDEHITKCTVKASSEHVRMLGRN